MLKRSFVGLLVAAFVLAMLFVGQASPAKAFDCSSAIADDPTGARSLFVLSMEGWAQRQGADVRWDRFEPASRFDPGYDPGVAPKWAGGLYAPGTPLPLGVDPSVGKMTANYVCAAAAVNAAKGLDWRTTPVYPNRYITAAVSVGDLRSDYTLDKWWK